MNPAPIEADKEIEQMVRKWFGEPVLAVEDEIKALVDKQVVAARIDEVERFSRFGTKLEDGTDLVTLLAAEHKYTQDRLNQLRNGAKDEN